MPDTTLHYPWDVRPGYEPLTRKEVALALKIADYDAEQAASILKVDMRPLDGVPAQSARSLSTSCRCGTVFPLHLDPRQRRRHQDHRRGGQELRRMIGPYNETDGTTVITLDKVSRELEALVRRAEAISERRSERSPLVTNIVTATGASSDLMKWPYHSLRNSCLGEQRHSPSLPKAWCSLFDRTTQPHRCDACGKTCGRIGFDSDTAH